MSDFKLCENGHYYPKGLEECPYCPSASNTPGQFNKSNDPKPDFGGGGNFQKTELDPNIFSNMNQENDKNKTQIFGIQEYSQDLGMGGDLSKTQIFNPNSGGSFEQGGFNMPSPFDNKPQSYGRKLVGWLVSFTIEENGADFQLFEGRNLIGSDNKCDIVVPNDAAVSGHHITILFRMGQFKLKDELSTNGTFVNDLFKEEVQLKDGDMIKIGETIFKFRSIA